MIRRLSVLLAASSLVLVAVGGAHAARPRVAATPAVHSVRACASSTSRHRASCYALVRTDAGARPQTRPFLPSGYGPAQFHSAYNWPTTTSKKQTIAIVDAFSNPKVFSDLTHYDKTYGLPAFKLCNKTRKSSCFSVMNQKGQKSPLPPGDQGWGVEIDLDVQAAHAVCQNCKLILVEAKDNTFKNLQKAVATAVAKGAVVVSNSYGATGFDCANAAYNYPNVAMLVSSGDSGYQVSCPASDSRVISVGGTTLNLTGGGAYSSESVWNGTGSGCSTQSPAKAWQKALSNWAMTGCGNGRAMNDISADADPATGAAVYDTYGAGGWIVVGGTSLSAPLLAGAYGLAHNAATFPYPAKHAYDNPSQFRDVTTGSNGSCGGSIQCNAGPGYDLPTGLGSPNGLGGL